MDSLEWQKSSFSGGGEGNSCVELARSGDTTAVRESDDPTGTIIVTPGGLSSLIRHLKGSLQKSSDLS